MTATERLRALLDERGVEWRYKDERTTYWYGTLDGGECGEWTATEMGGHLHLTFSANGDVVTPKQAIAATLGSSNCSCNCSCNCSNSERMSDVDATGERQRVAGKVYLVEACDELIEDWCPLVAYLSREAAGRHAELLRGEVAGVMSFARVVEMEVVGE